MYSYEYKTNNIFINYDHTYSYLSPYRILTINIDKVARSIIILCAALRYVSLFASSMRAASIVCNTEYVSNAEDDATPFTANLQRIVLVIKYLLVSTSTAASELCL